MHFFGLKIDAARALQRQLECGFLLQWSASLCRVTGMCRRLVAPTRTPRDMQISHCHLTSKARARGTSSVGAKPTGLSKHNQELSIVWACSRHSQPESMQQFMHVYNGNFGWQMHNSTGKGCERGDWVHGGFYKWPLPRRVAYFWAAGAEHRQTLITYRRKPTLCGRGREEVEASAPLWHWT